MILYKDLYSFSRILDNIIKIYRFITFLTELYRVISHLNMNPHITLPLKNYAGPAYIVHGYDDHASI